jgi:cytochrome c nitrite reductase small subunit
VKSELPQLCGLTNIGAAMADSQVGWPLVAAFFAAGVGVLVGIGGYTFAYAEGLSYFKTDPKACANCHIMQPEFDAWQKSSHHTAAVCVDCHLPHDFVPKYLAKAENGWRHGQKFTTGNFKEPIEVQAAGQKILQDNCVRCHNELTDEMRLTDVAIPAHGGGEMPCIKCHFTVGHGPRAGLGGPLGDDERQPQSN